MNLSAYQRNVLRQAGIDPVMAEQRAAAAAEQHARDESVRVQQLEVFYRKVTEALSAGDDMWRWRYRKMSEAEHAMQAIHNLFEALNMAREDMRHWRNEYRNAQAQLDRTLWRRFKRLFESIKAWERERWDKRWK